MPYAFEPRDLAAPRGEREHEAPPDPLADAFEAWLEERAGTARPEIGGSTSEAGYRLAVDLLDGLDVRAPDANSLLLQYGDALTPDVGLFLSAAYNYADEDVAFFDVRTEPRVERLGYRLGRAKTLVLDAPIDSTMAVGAAGLVVNRARVDSYFGYSADGAFVNAPGGSCLTAGFGAAKLFVDLGEVRSAAGRGAGGDAPRVSLGPRGGRNRRDLGPDALAALPHLEAFLDRLGDGLSGDRASVRAFLDDLTPTPREAIVAEVERRLDGAGVGL